ncbi:MAG: DnaK suppressor protein [Myxococcota bacterium]|jgi:DnaK suppressor protein
MAETLPPDEYLSTEQLANLHKMLEVQLNELIGLARENLHQLTDVRDNDADALDLAVTESNRDFSLRMADRERKLMLKIRHALQRMQDGDYGACQSCGDPITYKRLLARPVATLCIDCKTQAEHLEGARRAF